MSGDDESESTFNDGDMVRFVDAHHAMNGGLKGHEGDLGVVVGTGRGYSSDKTLVEFLEGASKKVIDQWDIKTERLEPATDGPWAFWCSMCGEEFTSDDYAPCPECERTSIRVTD